MSGEARIQAAAATIRAAWEAGYATAGDLALALDSCCLLRSPDPLAVPAPLQAPAEGGVPDAA
ncbi:MULTISPECIES: hypothetical protein [Streptomyces]|uniref:Uncharacterized protein n=1 Tax=Streptomyces erythrochromogenes TaxID=285574 RepID=A0ABZ1QER0_9ACTN|nr:MULTISPECIES: hypothetical protein [Streptomyces]